MIKNIPNHVAYIVDGNGRWATEKNLNRSAGHKKGAEVTFDIVKSTFNKGVSYITLYLFSIENWCRPVTEIDFIMELLEKFLIEIADKLKENNIILKIIGKITTLPINIQKLIQENINTVEDNNKKVLVLALSYSGKYDIIETCKRIMNKNINIEDLTEEIFSENTCTGILNIPEPDLIVRTSGEMRISNFYLWQASYSELLFIKKYWPDINDDDIQNIINEYSEKRIRRFGKL